MLDTILSSSVARQMMSTDEIEIEDNPCKVHRTSQQRLKCVSFPMAGVAYTAIEQNPEKPGRWGELARSGHQVVQFKSEATNKSVALAVDGEVKEY